MHGGECGSTCAVEQVLPMSIVMVGSVESLFPSYVCLSKVKQLMGCLSVTL